MSCRHYRILGREELRCYADLHECYCGGDRTYCDKDPSVCPFGVWQGPEVYCKQSGEIEECVCDRDFCELSDAQQMKIDWKKES